MHSRSKGDSSITPHSLTPYSAARTLASVTKASGVGSKTGVGSLSLGQSGGMEALMTGRGDSGGGGRRGRIGSTFIDAQLEELRNMQVGGA